MSSSQTSFPHLFDQMKFFPFWFFTPSVLPSPWPPSLNPGLFPISVPPAAAQSLPLQKNSSESGGFYFSISFLSSSSKFTIDTFSRKSVPPSSSFLFKFSWSHKILPTTCILRPGLEKLGAVFHTISSFFSSQTQASM